MKVGRDGTVWEKKIEGKNKAIALLTDPQLASESGERWTRNRDELEDPLMGSENRSWTRKT